MKLYIKVLNFRTLTVMFSRKQNFGKFGEFVKCLEIKKEEKSFKINHFMIPYTNLDTLTVCAYSPVLDADLNCLNSFNINLT